MATIKKYNSFKECFGLQSPFKSELLGFSIVEYSIFGNVNNVDETIFECMRVIGLNNTSEFELYVSSGGYGSTEKIRNYYALWKAIKTNHDISKFNIIQELKINIEGNIRYVGVSTFEISEFLEGLKILSNYQFNSYIYIKNDNNKCCNMELKEFFEELIITQNEKISYTIMDYDFLYSIMKLNDIVINIGYDGEEFSVYFIKKEI